MRETPTLAMLIFQFLDFFAGGRGSKGLPQRMTPSDGQLGIRPVRPTGSNEAIECED
jgi:hypothetical protein